MPRFFVEDLSPQQVFVTGEDAGHIAHSLRQKVGQRLALSDGRGTDGVGKIVSLTPSLVELWVEERYASAAEPPVDVTLYQALPKGDKLEFIVQKAVELGVGAVAPVLSRNCVSRPDEKAMAKKSQRLQKIAEEAAKQAGRGKIPRVLPLLTFRQALGEMGQADEAVLFYEKAAGPLGPILARHPRTLAVMVGPEGGFTPEEAEAAREAGLSLCTMGPRILRCETAPLYALSAAAFFYENLGDSPQNAPMG